MVVPSHIVAHLNSGLWFCGERIHIHYSGFQMTCRKVWESRCLWIWILNRLHLFLAGTITVGYFSFLVLFRSCQLLPDMSEGVFLLQKLSPILLFWVFEQWLSYSENSVMSQFACLLLLKYCILFKISALHNRGRSWSATLGQISGTRPHGWTARPSNAVE